MRRGSLEDHPRTTALVWRCSVQLDKRAKAAVRVARVIRQEHEILGGGPRESDPPAPAGGRGLRDHP